MRNWTRRIRHAAARFLPLTPHSSLLTASSAAAVALLLASCGFHLRGQASLPFETLYVSGSPLFANQVARAVRAGSKTRVINNPKDAQATLQILSELRERLILSLSAAGRVREISLRYRVAFRLMDATGAEFLPASEIVLRRDVTYSDSDVLGKEQEEALLYRDMLNDAVQQVVRRMQVAKLDTGSPAASGARGP